MGMPGATNRSATTAVRTTAAPIQINGESKASNQPSDPRSAIMPGISAERGPSSCRALADNVHRDLIELNEAERIVSFDLGNFVGLDVPFDPSRLIEDQGSVADLTRRLDRDVGKLSPVDGQVVAKKGAKHLIKARAAGNPDTAIECPMPSDSKPAVSSPAGLNDNSAAAHAPETHLS